MDIIVKETSAEDLNHVMDLWNNGEVMRYVGFPNGFGATPDYMEKWLKNITNNPLCQNFSIYTEELGYCGETFYAIDQAHDLAALDIKLLPHAQGKGIASYALSYTIKQVFDLGLATRAYVEPHPANQKALQLYNRLGFVSKTRPSFLEPDDTYMEVTKDTFTL